MRINLLLHALCQGMGMTQKQFTARFGFSVATLRHWERGVSTPQGASLMLLNGSAPDVVTAALSRIV
jgi:putative transcriptional regulator